MKKIGIIGATGYTGSELVRILSFHEEVEIALITSETHQGKSFSEIHPQFRDIIDIELHSAKQIDDFELDLVFLALPHGISMDYVREWKNKKFRIIDLSGDFRLSSDKVYSEWYHQKHSYPEGFEHAVFGLPELFRKKIINSRLVANPGCFPTGAILAVYPLLKENLIDPGRIIIDSKTGVTGAGVKPKLVTHFPNVHDNFKPYGIKNHRHTIEIQETLSKATKSEVFIQLTPHLLPVDRGILTSVYAIPRKKIDEKKLELIYHDYYDDEYAIRLPKNLPEIKHVRGTNFTDIKVLYDERTNNIMVFSAIDNLIKGAAGQAVQNMNLMLGLEEFYALEMIPVMP